jgi:hypothetical protein
MSKPLRYDANLRERVSRIGPTPWGFGFDEISKF